MSNQSSVRTKLESLRDLFSDGSTHRQTFDDGLHALDTKSERVKVEKLRDLFAPEGPQYAIALEALEAFDSGEKPASRAKGGLIDL